MISDLSEVLLLYFSFHRFGDEMEVVENDQHAAYYPNTW